MRPTTWQRCAIRYVYWWTSRRLPATFCTAVQVRTTTVVVLLLFFFIFLLYILEKITKNHISHFSIKLQYHTVEYTSHIHSPYHATVNASFATHKISSARPWQCFPSGSCRPRDPSPLPQSRSGTGTTGPLRSLRLEAAPRRTLHHHHSFVCSSSVAVHNNLLLYNSTVVW